MKWCQDCSSNIAPEFNHSNNEDCFQKQHMVLVLESRKCILSQPGETKEQLGCKAEIIHCLWNFGHRDCRGALILAWGDRESFQVVTCLSESSESIIQEIKLVIPSDESFENVLILMLLVGVESHGWIQSPTAIIGNHCLWMTSKGFGSNSLWQQAFPWYFNTSIPSFSQKRQWTERQK